MTIGVNRPKAAEPPSKNPQPARSRSMKRTRALSTFDKRAICTCLMHAGRQARFMTFVRAQQGRFEGGRKQEGHEAEAGEAGAIALA